MKMVKQNTETQYGDVQLPIAVWFAYLKPLPGCAWYVQGHYQKGWFPASMGSMRPHAPHNHICVFQQVRVDSYAVAQI